MSREKNRFFRGAIAGHTVYGTIGNPFVGFRKFGNHQSKRGHFAFRKKNHSFLPFDLRKKFNLPTFLENDAIYTYHFYRLLQRAKRVYLLYNTQSDGLNSGEMSRFLYQLKYQRQPAHQVEEKHLVLNYLTPNDFDHFIEKTENIQQQLRAIAEKGFRPPLFLFI